jgi:hypothetical protein
MGALLGTAELASATVVDSVHVIEMFAKRVWFHPCWDHFDIEGKVEFKTGLALVLMEREVVPEVELSLAAVVTGMAVVEVVQVVLEDAVGSAALAEEAFKLK